MLWGHYAEKHKGVCVGFDVPTKHLRQVSYVTSRFPWPEQLSQGFMEQVLFSKFVHWSYEDEYRAWASLDEVDDGQYYVNFSESLRLKQVLVGCESSLTRAEIVDALGDTGKDVESFKVRAAFRSFRIVRNEKAAMWA